VPEYVVPDAGPAKVDVKVGVAAAHRHQAVLLHLEGDKTVDTAHKINCSIQCFGSGSKWIRIKLAPLDPDPYWVIGNMI